MRHRKRGRGIVSLGTLLGTMGLVACSSVEIILPPPEVIEEITFHPSLGVNLAAMTEVPVGNSSIYIQELEEGDGDAAGEGNTVNVDFSGFLATNGRQFALEQGAGITLGIGDVPLGLDHAIRGMRPGERRRAVIPPELGYGRARNGNVPGGSVLVYEIEVTGIFSNP